ncbi:MAG: cobyric acid synthase [Phycisphaerae bacterium]|nr:cobyric acid synthase [Phycisphaerae bacterium]
MRKLAQRSGKTPGEVLDFSANINPLGPPECLRPVVSRALDGIVHYPDPDSAELVAAIARRYHLPAESIVVGNGSTELLHAVMRLGGQEKGPSNPSPLAGEVPALAGGGGPGRDNRSDRTATGQPPTGPEGPPPPQGGRSAEKGTGEEKGTGSISESFFGNRACPLFEPRRVLVPVPSYVDYIDAARIAGLNVETLPLAESAGFVLDFAALGARLRGGEMVLLGQPNNPTGLLFDVAEFGRFAAEHPTTLFVVDEAFIDFVEKKGTGSISEFFFGNRACPLFRANVIVLHSLTKFFGLPGLRLGFAAAPVPLADAIRRQLPPWSVNSIAQAVGAAALADEEYAARTVAYVAEQRAWLAGELASMPGLHVYPGKANFLLVRIDGGELDAHALSDRLLAGGIAIRTYDEAQHLDRRFFRVAVRTDRDNRRLVDALGALLAPKRRPSVVRLNSGAKSVMFQGTSSNAGKSILTAALCRILLQDGVRVAPFKSQNMSNNSFVSRDGGEMGRAQVVQAQACRLEPDVRMNPILLKPNSDTGCQVVVRGQPVGNMRVGQYVNYKPTAFAAAKECYDSLAGEFDVVVLEGAGSPGEVNLKSHDIVNMRMAEYARSPVLIVGDIDRGGVFASFVGTMEVLAEWERALVAGWVVNRFRGDASLLAPALDYTLAHTGRPVFGVVPYLADLNLPQEDSVEFKSGALDRSSPSPRGEGRGEGTPQVSLAVIDLPHISNFTDFDAFAVEPDVQVKIIRSAGDLDGPDAVVIPGSKNTLADLDYLRRSGLAERIAALAAGGQCEIVGVCGGFQMIGRRISDPHQVESAGGHAAGLGLLAADTVLAADKTLTRATARHRPSGLEVSGYEIHHGMTGGESGQALFESGAPGQEARGSQSLGVGSDDGRVWGTYLHGVFDADAFRRWFIDRLRTRRGLPPLGNVVGQYDIEPALDRLASVVRQSLKMDEIYRLLKL